MKIRSVTSFISPKNTVDSVLLAPLSKFSKDAASEFTKAGYEVQTTRLATTPFPEWIKPLTQSRVVELAVAAEASATEAGFGYLSLGPALPHLSESYLFVSDILKNTKSVFASAVIASLQDGISMEAMDICAEIILKAAHIEANGFANLRFAALANVPSGSPFFPAAYHSGKKPAFAIATQAADLAVAAFTDARDIEEGARALTEAIEEHAAMLCKTAEKLSKKHGIEFCGIDFSLAPFPSEDESIGTAFERLGVPRVGLQGSLAAAAILTQAIDKAKFKRAGFNGLLLPPLEDSTLANRAADGSLTVNDLLMFSAVCGTGLDTIPLPGDTKAGELKAVLLDLAALALRLDKPLTARLMPMPNKVAGDEISFDFPYFANSRVMVLHAEPLGSVLTESKSIYLSPRKKTIIRRSK